MTSAAPVVLLGSSGYLGRHIMARLAELEIEAVTYDSRSPSSLPDPIMGVVNAAGAGMTRGEKVTPRELLAGNVQSTAAAIEIATRRGAPLVHLGTALESHRTAALGNGYLQTKTAATHLLRLAADLGWVSSLTVLRPSLVYGGGGPGVVERMAETLASHKPFPLREPECRRDLVHVNDVARAVAYAVLGPPEGMTVLDVGSGEAVPLMVVADTLGRAIGQYPAWVRTDPLGDEVAEDDDLDVAAAAVHLGFRPEVSLEDGLAEVVARHLNGKESA